MEGRKLKGEKREGGKWTNRKEDKKKKKKTKKRNGGKKERQKTKQIHCNKVT